MPDKAKTTSFCCPTCGQAVELTTVSPIGLRITMLRTAKGLGVRELASQVGCSHAAISFAETGRHELSLSLAKGIARVLGVTLDELAGGVL